jgi:hypothetical protein
MLGAGEVNAAIQLLQLVSHIYKLYFRFITGIQSVNFATVKRLEINRILSPEEMATEEFSTALKANQLRESRFLCLYCMLSLEFIVIR